LDTTTLVGLAAGFLTTVSFVPQVLKVWKSRSARDLSLPTFAAFTAGVAIWLAFGIMKHDLAITLWNGVTLALAGALLVMKLRFG
jgi:MtN3 and saliva related transmembrane protein